MELKFIHVSKGVPFTNWDKLNQDLDYGMNE